MGWLCKDWVVALFLSMIGLSLSKPMGYKYPTPKVPFIEGPTMSTPSPTTPDCVPQGLDDSSNHQNLLNLGTPRCPPDESYDDYDPTDIPSDQAAPSDNLPSYKYPVPDDPLILPTTSIPFPDCVISSEQSQGSNQAYLEAGVPLCPDEYDDYNPDDIPEDQAAPKPKGYEYPIPQIPFTLPSKPTTPTTTPVTIPECVPSNQKNSDKNPQFLSAGVPVCPSASLPSYQTTSSPPEYDDYDPLDIPADQAEPLPDCVPTGNSNVGSNPKAGVPICPPENLPGYRYPEPENPLTYPSKPSTTPSVLPDCVPESEKDSGPAAEYTNAGVPICPTEGYSYPVPSIPLQLPERSREAKLVLEDDPDLLLIGLTHHEDDSYDPEYYDHNSPDYIDSMDTDDEYNESEDDLNQAMTESGISLTGIGKVFSFHVPSSFNNSPEPVRTRSKDVDMDSFNTISDGALTHVSKSRSREDSSRDNQMKIITQNRKKLKTVAVNLEATKLLRRPKMIDDYDDTSKDEQTQPGTDKTKDLNTNKIISRDNRLKTSVQEWLRRG